MQGRTGRYLVRANIRQSRKGIEKSARSSRQNEGSEILTEITAKTPVCSVISVTESWTKLLDAVGKKKCWHIAAAIIRIALLTGMRAGEIRTLTWAQVDLARPIATVGRSKTAAGSGRQIPMNSDLFEVLSAHAAWFTSRFGQALPEQYLFPSGKRAPSDPSKPMLELKRSGRASATRLKSAVVFTTCGTQRLRRWRKAAFLSPR